MPSRVSASKSLRDGEGTDGEIHKTEVRLTRVMNKPTAELIIGAGKCSLLFCIEEEFNFTAELAELDATC